MTDQSAPQRAPDSDPQGDLAAIVDYRQAVQRAHAAWPDAGSSHTSRTERSGIACAIIVLRHLLSHFAHENRTAFLSGSRKAAQSSLLEAALSLNSDGIWLLCDELASSDAPNFSFESLMQSASMQDAVWSNDYFRFFNQAFCGSSAHDSWHPVPDRVRLTTQDEHLRWNGVASNNLADHLSFYSTVKEDARTGSRLARPVNAPMVVQVRFCNEKPGLTFYKDLFQFDLSVLGDAPSGVLVFRYRCIAVVKHRATPTGHDTLRLYHVDGELLAHPSRGKFPWSDDWRVHDGERYSLFFIRTDSVSCDVRPLPADLFRFDAEDVRIAGSAKTPRESEATLPQASAAATAGPVDAIVSQSRLPPLRGRGHGRPQTTRPAAASRDATPAKGPVAPSVGASGTALTSSESEDESQSESQEGSLGSVDWNKSSHAEAARSLFGASGSRASAAVDSDQESLRSIDWNQPSRAKAPRHPAAGERDESSRRAARQPDAGGPSSAKAPLPPAAGKRDESSRRAARQPDAGDQSSARKPSRAQQGSSHRAASAGDDEGRPRTQAQTQPRARPSRDVEPRSHQGGQPRPIAPKNVQSRGQDSGRDRRRAARSPGPNHRPVQTRPDRPEPNESGLPEPDRREMSSRRSNALGKRALEQPPKGLGGKRR